MLVVLPPFMDPAVGKRKLWLGKEEVSKYGCVKKAGFLIRPGASLALSKGTRRSKCVLSDSNSFLPVKVARFYPNSASSRTYRKPGKGVASSPKGSGCFRAVNCSPLGKSSGGSSSECDFRFYGSGKDRAMSSRPPQVTEQDQVPW